ncbi:hypothetical protein SAMN04487830_14312 [Pseudobutyrivibrio sp. OR37]|uniref:hypothetical protein n=1 Tax=Pseudobutyrivibrio sp. OR37 TaxID=1798186 RepID=UPI0008E51FE5|nr:hypothetical protein [Pseudobutyrivibrio sp. OR37]SFI32894.1 hypothetical protein SAMN04487830_14312 [Pseudobutyrivibrio sp. OR37]
MKGKNIIIPDRIFHKIWNLSLEAENFSELYNSLTDSNSSYYIDFYKYGFQLELIYDTLQKIYHISNMSISDLLKEYNLKKATLSHRFCIPIRTIENWCNGTGKCAPYILLMILECYNISYLPENVYTESLFSKDNKTVSTKKRNKNIKIEEIQKNVEKEQDYSKLPLDDIDDLLDNISLETFSIKDFEQTHSIDNSSFLSETDYLRKHMK